MEIRHVARFSLDVEDPMAVAVRPQLLEGQIKRLYEGRCLDGMWLSRLDRIEARTPLVAHRTVPELYTTDCEVSFSARRWASGDIVCGAEIKHIGETTVVCEAPPLIIILSESADLRVVDVGSKIPVSIIDVQYPTHNGKVSVRAALYSNMKKKQWFRAGPAGGARWVAALDAAIAAARSEQTAAAAIRESAPRQWAFFETLFGADPAETAGAAPGRREVDAPGRREVDAPGRREVDIYDLVAESPNSHEGKWYALPRVGLDQRISIADDSTIDAMESANSGPAALEAMCAEAVLVELLVEWTRRLRFRRELILTYNPAELIKHESLWKMYRQKRK